MFKEFRNSFATKDLNKEILESIWFRIALGVLGALLVAQFGVIGFLVTLLLLIIMYFLYQRYAFVEDFLWLLVTFFIAVGVVKLLL